MSPYIAAIDQGTTSTRCLIYDDRAQVQAVVQKEHRQHFPRAGWVEHDPDEIMSNTRQLLADAITRAGLPADALACIGITNQRETLVVWDPRTGRPWHPAIVWQDTRSREICDRLTRDGHARLFRERTGLPTATYFTGPKLRWLLDHVDGLSEAAAAGRAIAGTIDSWLIWNLTGGPEGGAHVTDVTNASRTMLMDLRTLDWSPDCLEILDIPREMLPRIVPNNAPGGWGVTRLGGASIPVCAALGDQQAAMLGQLCLTPGSAKNTYGTGCFMLLNTGKEIVTSEHGLLTTVASHLHGDSPRYALEGSVAIAGSLVQWLRDNLGMIETSSDIEALACGVDDSGGLYFVPAFSGLFAPYWRADARGILIGLTHYITKAHIARAVLEATAYQTREVLDAMQADAGAKLADLRVDGGMTANALLMQFQADILGIPVVRPANTETTAMGAAFAAGLAAGIWESTDDLSTFWQPDSVWSPAIDTDRRERLLSGWKDAVQRSFNLA